MFYFHYFHWQPKVECILFIFWTNNYKSWVFDQYPLDESQGGRFGSSVTGTPFTTDSKKNLQILQASVCHKQISSWRGTSPHTVHVSPVPSGRKLELDHWCHKENQAWETSPFASSEIVTSIRVLTNSHQHMWRRTKKWGSWIVNILMVIRHAMRVTPFHCRWQVSDKCISLPPP